MLEMFLKERDPKTLGVYLVNMDLLLMCIFLWIITREEFEALPTFNLKTLEMQMMPCTIWMQPIFMGKTCRLNLPEATAKLHPK